MSYTNKTPNYELPQYTADDKPTYLGDFNKAMLDIDTNMKTIDNKATESVSTANTANSTAEEALETANSAQSGVSGATTTANQAKTTAENAQTTATNAQSDASTAISTANQAKSTADTANSIANQAKTTAETANSTAQTANTSANKALEDLNKFNLTNSQKITNVTPGSNVSSVLNCNITLISDSTNKVFKLYGKVSVAVNAKGYAEVSFQSNLRPSEEITIQGCGVAFDYDTGGVGSDTQIIVATNGQVKIRGNCSKNTYGNGLVMFNMLYFLDKFDQTLIPDME